MRSIHIRTLSDYKGNAYEGTDLEETEGTRRVLEELALYGDHGISERLEQLAGVVRSIVPECIGLSLALVESGFTFTLAASNEKAATLDAIQYLDGGPCIAAVDRNQLITAPGGEPLDEDHWQLHARATAAAGVASTLSMPLHENGEVIGGLNLYASTPDAFKDRVQQISAAVGASASEAVSNADLGFASRRRAEQGPAHLEALDHVNHAVGVLMVAQHIDPDTAKTRIHDAAQRAGLSESQVARALLALFQP